MNKRKIIIDSILSIIASAIPIIVLQLIVLPIVGLKLGDTEYGIAVTLISMATLFSLPFGNVLNNIRLLMDVEYKDKNISGDFNILVFSSIVINAIIMVIGTIYYENSFSLISILLVVIFSGLNILREYLIVTFRIIINYKSILINNIILGIGYLFGLLVFSYLGYWQLIYVFGASFSLAYINKKSNLLKEGFVKTKLFKKTTYKSLILFISIFMKSLLNYADKLILFPLLGPSAVSVYYSATLMGKIISMAITPISGVMLSYLAKMSRFKMKDFILMVSLVSIVGFLGYFIILIVSEPILNLLYPHWADESLSLIHITTATAIVGVITSVIHPVILRFNHINWQLFINFINLVIYVVCVMIFYNLYGLIGFCLGMLIASLIKLLIMIFVFVYNYTQYSPLGN
ncbi:hypothetical protein EDC19_1322 [Natranaerovirga hydrolytica]|uniref:O-antigen/teichoic acid export membrane protein n=1 Tax=Natranaerovirga hydrolytica TaxID=680378 RepID=A0A4R1MT61_9FIRM|nr:hypothetical protein [Natranaerovirga hydrolytica]TCK93143.1 hypothetical protein EDC19_1322 [Natranaerovirga hydrolytica]